MMDTILFIVAHFELVMINVPSVSESAPSMTFERLVCHPDITFVMCVTPQDLTSILLLTEVVSRHHLYSLSESVLNVELPIKNTKVKPVI